MNSSKKQLIKLLLTAILMAAGIVLILFSSIHYANFYPIFSILLFVLAIFFPVSCGACRVAYSDSANFLWDDTNQNTGAKLAWLFTGWFITLGYAVSIELFRGGYIPDTAVYLSLAGDTTVIIATLIFVKLIYYSGDDENNVYFF